MMPQAVGEPQIGIHGHEQVIAALAGPNGVAPVYPTQLVIDLSVQSVEDVGQRGFCRSGQPQASVIEYEGFGVPG